jgi:hypothetical protein
LGDEAADGKAKQIDTRKVHRLDEGDGVVSHGFDRARRPAGGGADADVVEGDHASIGGELIDQRGIPVVEVAAEVLQQDDRHITLTQVAVGVLDPVPGRNSLDRSLRVSNVRRCRHRVLPVVVSAG